MANKAFAYCRTSSAANAGKAYAAAHGVEIVQAFYDDAVRGSDLIETRKGFAAMLEAIAGNGVRSILVETANRFARDLIVQETGYRILRQQGIELIAVDSPTAFLDDTPTATLIRQILGAVAQFEKAALVAKLAAARKRLGKPGGTKPLGLQRPELAARAIALDQAEPTLSLRAFAARLAAEGFTTPSGKPYGPKAIRDLLRR